MDRNGGGSGDRSDGTGGWDGWIADLRLAAGFFTRIVPPPAGAAVARPLAGAARVFPLVGLALGVGAGAVYALAHGLGLPPGLSGACAVTALVLATGVLHEDGLADFADGLGARGDRARKLAAMRDSGTGAFGVVAVALALIFRVAALGAIAEPGLVFAALVSAGAVSRAAIPAAMLMAPPARSDGLGVDAGRPDQFDTGVALAIAAVAALIALGAGPGIAALVLAAVATVAVTVTARARIGGYTGDVLGAVQQAAEIAVLLAVAGSL